MIATCLTALYLSAVTFDVTPVALPSPGDTVFLAQTGADSPADVFVLRAGEVTIYSVVEKWPPIHIPLAEATSALDVADLDGDGQNELVTVVGDRITTCPIPSRDAFNHDVTPRELFELATQLAESHGNPYPFVLVVPWEGHPALALPCENTFELRAPDGTLLKSYPIGENAPQRVTFGRPFSYWPVSPPQAGAPGSYEAIVSRISEYEPNLPSILLPMAVARPMYRSKGAGVDYRLGETSYLNWLWFPLKTDGSSANRVHFTLAPPDYRNTLLVVRRGKTESWMDNGDAKTSPPLRYPGMLIAPGDDLPDLNGDGYVDALFWNSPEPGASVDALTRALLAGTWPVRVTAHLFDPERGRYEPTPTVVLNCRVPIGWFLEPGGGPPLKNIVLRDFDGDGETDFACSCGDKEFAIWLTGAGKKPAFRQEFSEPIQSVEFAADLSGRGRTSVGLRTDSAVYVVRPSL